MSKAHEGMSEDFKKKRATRENRAAKRAILKKAKVLYLLNHPDWDGKNAQRPEINRLKKLVENEMMGVNLLRANKV